MKNLTPELIAKAKAAASAEELFALAKENNAEITEEEAKTYFAQINGNGIVADEELDLIAGGCGDTVFYHGERVKVKTKRCKDCNGNIGIFINRNPGSLQTVSCIICGNIIISGVLGTDKIEKL